MQSVSRSIERSAATSSQGQPLEVERAAHGLRLRGTQLYLEPLGRPPLGFLAHARSASRTLPERTVATGPTVALLEASQPRALLRSAALPAAYGKPFALGAVRLTLHPAGLVLGSAQLRCEAEGIDVLYAGDLGASRTAEPREQLACTTLVLRATYGHPRYLFPPREQALAQVAAFLERTLAEGRVPVLLASPVGAAQELVAHLGPLGFTLRLHPAALRACAVYRAQGVKLPEVEGLEGPSGPRDILVLPPRQRSERIVSALGKPVRTCLLSGRALDGVPDGVDEALPLSDHLGQRDLIEYAVRSGARRVLTVHGFPEELALALRERGIDAAAVREHGRQLELPGFR